MAYVGKCPTCGTNTAMYEDDSPFKCANGVCADVGKPISKEVAMNQHARATKNPSVAEGKRNPLGLPSLTNKEDSELPMDRVLEARSRLTLEALETDYAEREKQIRELYQETESMRLRHRELKAINEMRSDAIKQLKQLIAQLTRKAVE